MTPERRIGFAPERRKKTPKPTESGLVIASKDPAVFKDQLAEALETRRGTESSASKDGDMDALRDLINATDQFLTFRENLQSLGLITSTPENSRRLGFSGTPAEKDLK